MPRSIQIEINKNKRFMEIRRIRWWYVSHIVRVYAVSGSPEVCLHACAYLWSSLVILFMDPVEANFVGRISRVRFRASICREFIHRLMHRVPSCMPRTCAWCTVQRTALARLTDSRDLFSLQNANCITFRLYLAVLVVLSREMEK